MKNVLLTKSEFCTIMRRLDKEKERIAKFSEALDEICEGYVSFNPNSAEFDIIMELLQRIFNVDNSVTYNTLDWWLDSTSDETRSTWFKGYVLTVNTYEKLYDLLVAEMEDKETDSHKSSEKLFEEQGRKCSYEEYCNECHVTYSDFSESKNVTQDEFFDIMKEEIKKKLESKR